MALSVRNAHNRRGLTLLEYTLLLIVVIAAFLGMQIYLKRALAGKWKDAADTFGYGRQY